MKIKTLYTIFLFLCFCLSAESYTIQSVPNPKSAMSDSFVSNPDAILSAQTVEKIDDLARQLRGEVNVELAVVAIDGMDGDYIENFANRLFNYWGIGGRADNQGVLLLLDRHERAVRIEVGDGCEGLLPDVVCNDIIYFDMVPYLSVDDYDQGLLAGVESICTRLTTEQAKQELLFGIKPKSTPMSYYVIVYLMICFAALLLAVVLSVRPLLFNAKKPNNERYAVAQRFFYLIVPLAIICFFPVAIFAWWYKKRAMKQLRYRPMSCRHCGTQMELLSEKEEDKYMLMSQIAEERVGSIDYDVWLCPQCKHHEVLPYVNRLSHFSTCPRCGARTYALSSNVVLVAATQYNAGKGVRNYSCENCGHKLQQVYIIPRIVAPSGGGGKGYGGSSGGSWGGGHSSGGGATGRF